MLRFALPALGIYVADPIMSNIDNGFVGQIGGTAALAALGPGTVVANNLLFIFNSILNSATTGLVARALADRSRGTDGASAALSQTLSFAWTAGMALTIFYLVGSPWLLRRLSTPAALVAPAAAYARVRGAVAWAVLSQSVCLSAILATRDAVTPLKVVMVAAALNFTGDWLLCFWPLQTGVVGAAAATSLSTLAGFSLMLRALSRKSLMPQLRPPRPADFKPVFEYAAPLFVITSARVLGFTAMGITAAELGTVPLAAFQVTISIFSFFAFFSAPMSQTAQAMLPPLVDAGNTKALRLAMANILMIGVGVSAFVTALSSATLLFGGRFFTSDQAVIQAITGAAPGVVLAVGSLMVSGTIDGSLVAAKDFKFIIPCQIAVCCLQLYLLHLVRLHHLGLVAVFLTFCARLWATVTLAAIRVLFGFGPLGRVVRGKLRQSL